jgi:hypothetical protein
VDLQICCHFTTQNSKTDIKTNGGTNKFPICLFVLSEQLVPSLTLKRCTTKTLHNLALTSDRTAAQRPTTPVPSTKFNNHIFFTPGAVLFRANNQPPS